VLDRWLECQWMRTLLCLPGSFTPMGPIAEHRNFGGFTTNRQPCIVVHDPAEDMLYISFIYQHCLLVYSFEAP
jgi:hypothetical protein